MNSRNAYTRIALCAFAATLSLAACGKRGVLDRPEPVFGRPAKDASAETTVADPAARVARPTPRAPESVNSSIRNSPIDGAPRDPRAGPPQG